MPFSIGPNAGNASRLQNQHARGVRAISQSVERLSTGKRINRPSDDPSGFIAVEQLRGELADIRGELKSFGSRRLASAERGSALANFQSGLNDLRERVAEAANGPLSQAERATLQEQVDAAYEAFEWISSELGAGGGSFVEGERIDVTVDDTTSAAAAVEQATTDAAFEQARVGIDQRLMDKEEDLLRDREVIVTQTISQIEDTDFAEETSNLVISQVLTEAASVAMVYSRQAHATQIGGLLDQLVEGNEPSAA